MIRIATRGVRCALLAAFLASAAAGAAEVKLHNAWMRPAPAGAESAKAYVDIASDSALALVGASTPAARKVLLVAVTVRDATIDEKPVRSLPISAGTPTRLAFNGSHLLLSGITRDIGNGDPVPLTLTFKDAGGKLLQVPTEILVRGLLRPEQVPATTGERLPAPQPPMTPKLPEPPPTM
jgi:copper(I)-binding protein